MRGRITHYDPQTLKGNVAFNMSAHGFHSTSYHGNRAPRPEQWVDLAFNSQGKLVSLIEIVERPDPDRCTCGHSLSGTHNEYGCFVKEGHDEYCWCRVQPPALVAEKRAYRLRQVLCYPCKKHPRYKVRRAPRTACEKCWRMWITVNP